MTVGWEAAGATHVGRVRAGNEDCYRLDPPHGVFLVADGMGGHAAGEVASELGASTIAELAAAAVEGGAGGGALADALRDAFFAAQSRIHGCCVEDPATQGMGTTVTACVLRPDGACHVAHIGDSRLYRVREGAMEQLTTDHTWVQREIDAGRLPPAAAHSHPLSHILTRVLSEDGSAEPDLRLERLRAGDLLLLATDGLYNMLPDARIAALLSDPGPLPQLATSLIDAANDAGGADNVTVVLVRVLSAHAPSGG